MREKREELEKLEKNQLIDMVLLLCEEVGYLKARVAELEEQIRQNSSNSSKPPSSDGAKKPNTKSSLREKSGRKPGGQAGHKGAGHRIAEPDEIIEVVPSVCPKCGESLEGAPAVHQCSKYESDLPEIRLWTVKFDFYSVTCPKCGTVVNAELPRMTSTFRYGDNIRALATAMNAYCMVSVDKTAKMLSYITGQPISAGTVMAITSECAKKCTADVEAIKAELKASEVLHPDETGCRTEGKTQWAHVVSNDEAALFTVSPKRGKEGTDKSGVLDDYEGMIMHDCWSAYFKFDKATHALCNAHVLRELKAAKEATGQAWCDDMSTLLVAMKHVKARYIEKGKGSLSRYYLTKFSGEYGSILDQAKALNPRNHESRKQTKTFNLIERLDKYQTEFCRFATDFTAPFDNNQAERAIRPFKVKLKVSGGFRTNNGADNFAMLFSVIQTTIKRSANVFNKIKSLFSLPEPIC